MSAVHQDVFPLLVASDESVQKAGDEINQWAALAVKCQERAAIAICDQWKMILVLCSRASLEDEGESDSIRCLGFDRMSSAVLACCLRRM